MVAAGSVDSRSSALGAPIFMQVPGPPPPAAHTSCSPGSVVRSPPHAGPAGRPGIEGQQDLLGTREGGRAPVRALSLWASGGQVPGPAWSGSKASWKRWHPCWVKLSGREGRSCGWDGGGGSHAPVAPCGRQPGHAVCFPTAPWDQARLPRGEACMGSWCTGADVILPSKTGAGPRSLQMLDGLVPEVLRALVVMASFVFSEPHPGWRGWGVDRTSQWARPAPAVPRSLWGWGSEEPKPVGGGLKPQAAWV